MAHRRVAVMVGAGSGHTNGILHGIIRYAVAHGPWDFAVQFPGLSIVAVRDWDVDGIIVPLGKEEYARVFRGRDVPVVNCSGVLAVPGVPTVRVADREVGRTAAQHLLDRGFARFGFVGFPEFDFSRLRRAGFEEVLRASGLECAEYVPDPALKNAWTWDAQELDLARWAASLERPVAVLACNDERAWHLAEACRRAGLRVPEEVAILGVDNDELRCEFTTPPLSSVAVPAARIGFEAAALLDRLMDGDVSPDATVFVHPQGVVARQSTNTLPAADDDVAAAFKFIADNAGDAIRPDDVAARVGSSVEALDGRFRAQLGRSLADEIRRARAQRAERILSETDLAMADVARASGFRTTRRFARAFRSETGLSPTDYRRRFRLG